ncbi:hypothetical protein ACJX0J_037221, partial [Zea mays]
PYAEHFGSTIPHSIGSLASLAFGFFSNFRNNRVKATPTMYAPTNIRSAS